MTDLTLETFRTELAQSRAELAQTLRTELAQTLRTELAQTLRTELEPMRSQLESVRAEQASMRAQLETLRTELAPMRAQLDGLPLINRALTVLQQEMRSLKAAFNDFARTNVTAGEIEALHADVNRVQAENAELQTRLATVERLLQQLQKQRT